MVYNPLKLNLKNITDTFCPPDVVAAVAVVVAVAVVAVVAVAVVDVVVQRSFIC